MELWSYRRPRNTRQDPVTIGIGVERTTRDGLKAVAAAHGISLADLLERLYAKLCVELSEDPDPEWLPRKLEDEEIQIELN